MVPSGIDASRGEVFDPTWGAAASSATSAVDQRSIAPNICFQCISPAAAVLSSRAGGGKSGGGSLSNDPIDVPVASHKFPTFAKSATGAMAPKPGSMAAKLMKHKMYKYRYVCVWKASLPFLQL